MADVKRYTDAFKMAAAAKVVEDDNSVIDVANEMGVATKYMDSYC